MIAFHITKKNYEEGKTYNIDTYNGWSYYHNSLNDSQKAINDAIDSCRPQNEPSRKKCYYAFECPDFCLGFVNVIDGYNLYKIDINTSTYHPMYLIDFINRNKNLLNSLACVYWDQTLVKSFQLKELIGTEIHIISSVKLPTNNTLCKTRMISIYNQERDVLNSICQRMGLK